jgi:hypothetical protein
MGSWLDVDTGLNSGGDEGLANIRHQWFLLPIAFSCGARLRDNPRSISKVTRTTLHLIYQEVVHPVSTGP